ncbi:MAG: cobalt-precorrin-7 (C(5))-methyltransferase [Methanobacteriaceae archaeon]
MMSKLFIVGIGPGSKDYLTGMAIKTVESCEVAIGSKRALDLFDCLDENSESYNSNMEKVPLNVKDVDEKLELAVDLAINGTKKGVCVLSTGDPGFSGVLKPILKIATDKGVSDNDISEMIEVIPGISSLQLAAAKTQIPWDTSNIITFHGREDFSEILEIIDNGRDTIALPSRSVKDMAQFLIDNGLSENRKVAICERLSYNDEKVVFSTLKDVATSDFTYMCVMVIYST